MTRNRLFLCLLCLCVAILPFRGHAETFSDVTFVGSVSTGSWPAIGGISAVATNGGYYTNAVTVTNYYRLSGTNASGRLPLSTNVVCVLRPGTGTNALQLSWTRAPGVLRQVIEKSYDQGGTWSNWLTVAPGASTWLDTGSNTWSTNSFTNLYAQIPAGSYPWATVLTLTVTSGETATNPSGSFVVDGSYDWQVKFARTDGAFHIFQGYDTDLHWYLSRSDVGYPDVGTWCSTNGLLGVYQPYGADTWSNCTVTAVLSVGQFVGKFSGEVEGVGSFSGAISNVNAYGSIDLSGSTSLKIATNTWSAGTPYLRSDDGLHLYWGGSP